WCATTCATAPTSRTPISKPSRARATRSSSPTPISSRGGVSGAPWSRPRGVRVVLLLQGRVEYLLLHYASRALYGTLLDSGVQIFEYHRSFLHAKVAVIDGQWATVGSSNIDPFS